MKDILLKTLTDLTGLDGPPGFEQPVVEYLRQEFEKTSASVSVDPMGNLYARLGDPAAKPHLMISAHSDEIAGVVRHIDNQGFIRIDPLGGLIPSHMVGQRVRVAGHLGVVGVRPGHLQSPDERLRVPPIEDLFIDVGAASAEDVARLGIRVGSPMSYAIRLERFSNSDRVTGKAIDNRAGCAVLLQVFRELAGQLLDGCLTALIAVQEEVGMRGAEVGTYHAMPDYAVVVDTLPVADTPNVPAGRMPGAIGKGPVLVIASSGGEISRGHIVHPKVLLWLEQAAAEAQVPIQLATSIGRAVTDAASTYLSREGVPTGVVGLPRRYSHSPICTLDLNDAMSAVALLKTFVARMDRHSDLSFISARPG
jgi:putative aminopeptidase FrvX